jgi:hypothetical protein
MFRKSTLILIATAVVLVGVSVWCLLPDGADASKETDDSLGSSATLQEVDTPLSDGAEADDLADSVDEKSDDEIAAESSSDDSKTDSSSSTNVTESSSTADKPSVVDNSKTAESSSVSVAESSSTADKPSVVDNSKTAESSTVSGEESSSTSSSSGKESSSATKDKYQTEPVPADKPKPVEPEKPKPDVKKTYSCTIYIECGKLLEGDNINKLDKNKVGIVPKNGVILSKRKVTFSEGESVFDVLKRETKANKIHMEFVNTPVYNSAYIEGIANLYEFDAGNLSGWVYSVNDWFPNYGSSRYQLEDGDEIEWHYTLDLGRDFGLDF